MRKEVDFLRDAMEIVRNYHDVLIEQHDKIPLNFWGNPTKKHYEILQKSRACLEIHTLMHEKAKTLE